MLREINAQICLFQDVEQTRHRPPPANLPLEFAQVLRFFWASEGEREIQPLCFSRMRTLARAGERSVEGRQGLAHLCLQRIDERPGLEEARGLIVFRTLHVKVLREVIFRIAIFASTSHPQFPTAQLLAQCLKTLNS